MTAENTTRIVLRYVAAIGFIAAGVMHFVHADWFTKIVPPAFPAPEALVAISGFFEIVGGVGLLIPPLRGAASWGLIALLIAVFPANIYMVAATDRIADFDQDCRFRHPKMGAVGSAAVAGSVHCMDMVCFEGRSRRSEHLPCNTPA